MNKRAQGASGEDIAAAFLTRRGYRILRRNFRCRFAEIDIIAEQDKTVCFIEVKSRCSDRAGSAAEAVDGAKQQRIARAAQLYLQQQGREDSPARFDVVTISAAAGRQEISLIEDAFEVQE